MKHSKAKKQSIRESNKYRILCKREYGKHNIVSELIITYKKTRQRIIDDIINIASIMAREEVMKQEDSRVFDSITI